MAQLDELSELAGKFEGKLKEYERDTLEWSLINLNIILLELKGKALTGEIDKNQLFDRQRDFPLLIS